MSQGKTPADIIENYMIQAGYPHEKLDENMWTIHDDLDDIDNIIITVDDLYVYFEINVLNEPPKANRESFYEKLLRLNAESLFNGAYALNGGRVVMVQNMPLENFDLSEFQGIVEAMITALLQDYKELKHYFA